MRLPILVALAACGSNAAPPQPQPTPHEPPTVPSYEVHEWGLVRRVFPDRVVVSGPPGSAATEVLPVAKPVLYFHRDGEGPLAIDVDVTMPSGHVVEHWPLTGPMNAPSIRWANVGLVEGHCPGAHYPSLTEAPCNVVSDFCEAAELAIVEAEDGDCLHVGGATFDHLFYRGEVTGAPDFPLDLALDDDELRVTNRGRAPIPGSIVRVRRDLGLVSVTAAPAPGATVGLVSPATPSVEGARALAASLVAAGLTEPEARAFARAWDEALFGASAVTTTPPAGNPVSASLDIPSPVGDAILYVLPGPDADALATLRFDPPPRVVRRAIVAWIDVALGRPVQRTP
ncbi:MAG: hypothetical protein H6721_04005 [Sandaracinus sp.]|nr:hypothetical protein [Sandaracinus sp.]MCB9631288.1 hypothetical protein [Sandaracinus sp.]